MCDLWPAERIVDLKYPNIGTNKMQSLGCWLLVLVWSWLIPVLVGHHAHAAHAADVSHAIRDPLKYGKLGRSPKPCFGERDLALDPRKVPRKHA